MDAHSESRQGVLTLTTAKTKFVAVRIFIIKGPAEQPEPTTTVKIPLAEAKTCCPDLLEHETLGYKKGRNNYFEGRRREKSAINHF